MNGSTNLPQSPSSSKPLAGATPQLSLSGKTRFIFRLVFLAPPQILFNVVRCLCLATVRRIPLRYYARSAFCRFSLGKLSALEIQFSESSWPPFVSCCGNPWL